MPTKIAKGKPLQNDHTVMLVGRQRVLQDGKHRLRQVGFHGRPVLAARSDMDGNMGTSLMADIPSGFQWGKADYATSYFSLYHFQDSAAREAARGVIGARLNRNGEELYRWRSDSRGAPALFIPRVNIADLARSDGTHRGARHLFTQRRYCRAMR